MIVAESEAELGAAHGADHGVVLPEAEGRRRAVAELGRGLGAHPEPLVGGEGGPGPVGVHTPHRELNVLHLAARGHGGDLDQGVQGDLDVGQVRQGLVHEVREDRPQHGLVGNQNNIFLSDKKKNVKTRLSIFRIRLYDWFLCS